MTYLFDFLVLLQDFIVYLLQNKNQRIITFCNKTWSLSIEFNQHNKNMFYLLCEWGVDFTFHTKDEGSDVKNKKDHLCNKDILQNRFQVSISSIFKWMYMQRCASSIHGVRAGPLGTRRSLVQSPAPPSWLFEVSLSKTPRPNCLRLPVCLIHTPLSVCESVHKWMNVRQYCKAL